MRELKLIEEYYGDKVAERSGVPLIEHIYQGLTVMDAIGARKSAMQAFCLHPIFQDDEALKVNCIKVLTECLEPWVMTLVMEYRNQANAWLSDKVQDGSTYSYSDPEPRLVVEAYELLGKPAPGPLSEVRDMLIADKVQNYKDFREYHLTTHPRARELVVYFETWLKALDVTPEDYISYCDAIDADKQQWGV